MASMKDLLRHAQQTREQVVDPSSAPAHQSETFEVPRCSHCGAPREASEGKAQGALMAPCRFCGTK